MPTLLPLIRRYASARSSGPRSAILRELKATPHELLTAVGKEKQLHWVLPQILHALSKRRVKVDAELFYTLLEDADGLTVHNACQAIIDLDLVDGAADTLVRVAFEHRDAAAACAAMTALEKAPARAFATLLARASRPFRPRSRMRRHSLLLALAAYRKRAAERVFTRALTSDDAQERFAAALGLARLGKVSGLRVLREGLDDPDFFDVVMPAADALTVLLGRARAVNDREVARLAKWVDAHPADVRRIMRSPPLPLPRSRTWPLFMAN